MVELMALLPDAGQGDAARSHHGPLHHVFRPDKRPSTHRHPLRKVSSGLALRGSVAGSDPAAARPNESVMLGPSAVNTAKPASPSSRWSQALPVEGVTPADMAVLSMGERTRPPTPRQATAPCSVTMDDQTCDHGKSQSSAARPARCPSRDDSLEPAVNRCGRRFGKPTMAPSARPICTPPLLRSANPRVPSGLADDVCLSTTSSQVTEQLLPSTGSSRGRCWRIGSDGGGRFGRRFEPVPAELLDLGRCVRVGYLLC